MEHEQPTTPEVEATPPTLFNVDAMNDDQIVALARGLLAAGGDWQEKHDPLKEENEADTLFDKLSDEISDMASRDPERVKNLVQRCLLSEEPFDHELAAVTADSLVDHDYHFTRDALTYLIIAHRHGFAPAPDASELAHMRLRNLQHKLTGERQDDFDNFLILYGSEPVFLRHLDEG